MEGGPTVDETIARLVANGVPFFEWRCTPVDLDALVIGRLYIEGLIDNAMAIVDALEIGTTDDGAIEIRMNAPLRAENSRRARGAEPVPDVAGFTELFRMLFTTVDERHESGGMHAAALAAGGKIAFQSEDVGRHNAVDKVVGMALLAGADPRGYGMIVSARVSGEIARKAAQAGITWLASRSIPTTMAVRIAREAGMPLIGRAAGKGAFFYQ
jgi:formate dehydrogenase accessory protein FdhD